MTALARDYTREHWGVGSSAWFEYHCWESEKSADANLWHHSHQRVTVLGEGEHDGGWGTFDERAEAGTPTTYRIRFGDGFEGVAFEDEILSSRHGFQRPAPIEKACGVAP